MTFKEVVYVAATILISLIIRLTEVRAEVLIELNGSIVSFFFIYVIPIGLHLKCVYFSTPEEREHRLSEKEKALVEEKGEIEMKEYKEHGDQKEHNDICRGSEEGIKEKEKEIRESEAKSEEQSEPETVEVKN